MFLPGKPLPTPQEYNEATMIELGPGDADEAEQARLIRERLTASLLASTSGAVNMAAAFAAAPPPPASGGKGRGRGKGCAPPPRPQLLLAPLLVLSLSARGVAAAWLVAGGRVRLAPNLS